MSEISVTIVGNITRNPEMKITRTGKAVAKLRVASTRKRYVEGRWVDGETAFIDVDCWDYLAQNVMNSLRKGDRVLVEGRLRTEEWEEPGGGKRQKLVLGADAIGPDLRWATADVTRHRPAGAVTAAERRAREAEMAGGAESPGRDGGGDGRGGGSADGTYGGDAGAGGTGGGAGAGGRDGRDGGAGAGGEGAAGGGAAGGGADAAGFFPENGGVVPPEWDGDADRDPAGEEDPALARYAS